MDVVVDITKDNANVFKVSSIEDADEVEIPSGERFVMITPHIYDYEQSDN